MYAFQSVLPIRAASHSLSTIPLTSSKPYFGRLIRPYHSKSFLSHYPSHLKPRTISPCMRVATDGDCVNVHYTGFLDDGTQFDSSLERGEPLNFTIGDGAVIAGFDDAVRGLKPGESRKTRIEPNRAYGQRNEQLIMTLPKTSVPAGLDLKKGQRVPLSNGISALVVEINNDGILLDANHQLAGQALTFDMQLVGFTDKILSPPIDPLKRAIFGLGCFWGAELAFQRINGVISTKVGYTHGQLDNPTYRQVCSGNTGHVEAVAVDYDPTQVTYQTLVDLFWQRLGNSALTINQVGNDVGTQYRSGIYYLDDEQKQIAEESVKAANDKFGKQTVVEVLNSMDVPFYLAEEYHQRYLEKGGQSAEKNATETIRCYG